MKWNGKFTTVFVGVTLGSVATLIVHPLISFFIPVLGIAGFALGYMLERKQARYISSSNPSAVPSASDREQNPDKGSSNSSQPANEGGLASENRFSEVLSFLDATEAMITEEGNSNNLDNEIVIKSLGLIDKIRHLLSEIEPMHDGDLDYTVTRLVTKDLNSFVTPFLRLSGELKIQNRRVLLDGIKDIHSNLDSIFNRLQQQDLLKLKTKGDIIRSRYSTREL